MKPRESGGNTPGAKPRKVAKPRKPRKTGVFAESPIRNPIERMQTQQRRHTARSVQNAAHAERGSADRGAIPRAPKRPLTKREVDRILNSGPGRSVLATVTPPKPRHTPHSHSHGGFHITPAAILADVPAELKGAGAIEAAITRIGAASAKGWENLGGAGKIPAAIVKDTAGIAAGAVPSVYLPAKEALTGHPGKAAGMVYGGVKETVTHPGKHPVGLALILRGGEGAASRTAGEIARHGTKSMREYGATAERAPIHLGGTALEMRRHSKGLIENRAQRRSDARAPKTTVKIPVHDEFGKPVREPVHYHGSGARSEEILGAGLHPGGGNEGAGVYLADAAHRGTAEHYMGQGGSLYAVNTRGLKTEGGGSETVVRGHVPAKHVKLVPVTSVDFIGQSLERLRPDLSQSKAGRDFLARTTGNGRYTITAEEARAISEAASKHSYEEAPALWAMHRDLSVWLEEHAAAGKAGRLHTTGDVTQHEVQALRATEHQLKGLHVTGGKRNRRVDVEAGKGAILLRDARSGAMKLMHEVKPGHDLEDVVPLVSRGVVKNEHTIRTDIEAEISRLQQKRHELHGPAELTANAEHIAALERFRDNPHLEAEAPTIFAAARAYAQAHAGHEQQRVGFGDLSHAQAVRRVLLDFAAREMGAHLRKTDQGEAFTRTTEVPPDPQAIAKAEAGLRAAKQDYHNATEWAAPETLKKYAQKIDKAQAKLERTQHSTTTEEYLTNGQIRDAFEKAGGDVHHLGYIPGAMDFEGSKNFYGSLVRRPTPETKHFTGRSATHGLNPPTYERMRQQLSNASVKVARHKSVNNLVNTFGMKQTNGEFFDGEGAWWQAANLKAEGQGDWVPLTAAHRGAPDTLVEDLTPEEFQQTWKEADPGDSHVVLFPKEVADRLLQHEKVRTPVGAEVQRVSQAFRHVVLLTSTKWLVGNGFEGYLRMQINELTPVGVIQTIRAGKQFERDVEALGPEGKAKIAELRAAAAEGLFRSDKYHDLFQPDNNFAKFLTEFRHSGVGPGGKVGPEGIANLWDRWGHAVRDFNSAMELNVYWYALGKEARQEVGQFTNTWGATIKHAGPAYQAVLEGATDSNKVAQYARAVDDIRGRYANLSPKGRYFVSTYTPFAPWYVNALHFYAKTLPLHHPVKTGALAAASAGTQEKRDELNLPPWGQGVPISGGRVLPVQHFTPAGVFEAGSAGPSSLVLPQIHGIQANLEGRSWSGQRLPEGTNNAEIALNTAIGTFVPFANRIQTVLEKGGKSAPTSTLWSPKTKDGKKSFGAGALKAINPLRPMAVNPDKGNTGWGTAGAVSSPSSGWGTAAPSKSSSSSSGWGTAAGG